MQAHTVHCGYFPVSAECDSCPLDLDECPNIAGNESNSEDMGL